MQTLEIFVDEMLGHLIIMAATTDVSHNFLNIFFLYLAHCEDAPKLTTWNNLVHSLLIIHDMRKKLNILELLLSKVSQLTTTVFSRFKPIEIKLESVYAGYRSRTFCFFT
jgi:hypothetical protein